MAETGPSVRLEALLAHREWVRGLAFALVRDDAEAADLEQEVWLAAVRRPPRDASSPRGWLATALRHALSNLRRGQRRRGARERAAARPEAGPSADAVVAEAEAHRRVVDAVMDLEEPYRTAVLLRFFEGLDLAAVAARTGVPPETARTRLKRARERLQDRLGGDDRDGRRALGLCLLPLLRDALPGSGAAAPLVPVAGGLAMTLKTKAAIAAAAAVLLLFVGRFVLATGDPPPPPAAGVAVADGLFDPDPEPAPPPPAPAPDAAATPASAPRRPERPPLVRSDLGVRIVDSDGDAVPGARFILACRADPFAPDAGPPAVERGTMDSAEGLLRTATFETDDQGRWSWRFLEPRRLRLVPIVEEPGDPLDGTWLDTPAPDTVLRVPRVPKGTLIVRAVDLSTDVAARGFTAELTPARPRERVADGEVLRTRVRMPGGRPVAVSLRRHSSHQPVDEEAQPADGGEATLTLSYRSKPWVRGRVLGPDGLPVQDAHVWLRGPDEGRESLPFTPFDERRLKGSTRTDHDGRFEARGEGNLVSVWHSALSSATVPVAEAPDIRLAARGSIRGVVLDEQDRPVAGQRLSLDGGPGKESADDGSFRFEGVEAGPRVLVVGKQRQVVVRVEPGQEARVEITPGIHWVDVELRSGADAWRGSLGRAAVLPLGPVGTLHWVQGGGSMIALREILPGTYLLMDETGRHAAFEVSGRRTAADLGTSGLVLHAPRRLPLFVIPVPGRRDPLVESIARILQRISARDAEPVRVEPLPAGEIEILGGEVGQSVRRTRVLEPGKTFEVQFSPR